MTAKQKAASKPEKVSKKPVKPVKPKLVAVAPLPPKGDNKPPVNQRVLKKFEEIELLQKNMKAIGDRIKDIKVSLKVEDGHPTANINDQIRLRKMAADVRANFEHGRKRLDEELGYQYSLEGLDEEDDGQQEAVQSEQQAIAEHQGEAAGIPLDDETDGVGAVH